MTKKFAGNLPQNITNIIQNFTPQNTTMAAEKNLHRKEKGDICTSVISIKGKSVQNLASIVLVKDSRGSGNSNIYSSDSSSSSSSNIM